MHGSLHRIQADHNFIGAGWLSILSWKSQCYDVAFDDAFWSALRSEQNINIPLWDILNKHDNERKKALALSILEPLTTEPEFRAALKQSLNELIALYDRGHIFVQQLQHLSSKLN